MELTRRNFCRLLLASVAAFSAGIFGAVAQSGPVRCLRAVKARVFPGRVRPIDAVEISQLGRWLG